jgi:HK97 family phage portal protein
MNWKFWNKAAPKQEEKVAIPPQFWNAYTPAQRLILADVMGANDFYTKLWVVNAAIHRTAIMAAKIPFTLQKKSGEKVTDHVVLDLYGSNPNPRMSGNSLTQLAITYLMLNGNNYEYIIGTPQKPIEVWPLMAHRVTPEEVKDGDIAKVQYKDESNPQKPETYRQEQIIQAMFVNPNSRIKGLGRLEAGKYLVNQSEMIAQYNSSILKKGGYPSMHFSTDQSLNEQQRKDIEKLLNQYTTGPQNAGAPLITGNGVKVVPLMLSPKDLDLLNNEKVTASMIATLLGVPVEILGAIGDTKTYNNMREAKEDFITNTVIPYLEIILTARARYHFPNGEYEFVIETNQIDVFKKGTTDLATQHWTTGNEKRIAQGYKPIDDPQMDEILYPSGSVTSEELTGSKDVL